MKKPTLNNFSDEVLLLLSKQKENNEFEDMEQFLEKVIYKFHIYHNHLYLKTKILFSKLLKNYHVLIRIMKLNLCYLSLD